MQTVTTSQIVETLLTKGELVLPDFGEGNRILESELKGFNNREVLQSVLTDLGYRKYRGVWQK